MSAAAKGFGVHAARKRVGQGKATRRTLIALAFILSLLMLALPVIVIFVEALSLGGFDLVTSRAFASLADFTALTRHHLAPSGVWLALKGKRPDDEIQALLPDIEVFHVEPLMVPGLDAERCLVWMRSRAG